MHASKAYSLMHFYKLAQACYKLVRVLRCGAQARLALCDPWLQPEVVHSNTHIKKENAIRFSEGLSVPSSCHTPAPLQRSLPPDSSFSAFYNR